jgi:hypothetical protein
MNVLSRTALIGIVATAAVPLALVGPAAAKGGGGDRVVASGSCTGGGVWKLKAKHDDARVEWEFEVDTNRVGQVWKVTVKDNGGTVFSGNRTTLAPSGSFSVERTTVDKPGTDRIVATATRGSATCTGAVGL